MEMYQTPEGFELSRPLLLPDALSFADVLEYLGEWDRFKDHEPEPRVIGIEIGNRRKGNAIGPYCTLERVHGVERRTIAVRATDATMNVLDDRIVTDDDTLSFRLIAHERSGRVLVILEHGYIIGSHYLAYIDPATIPAYPYERRDERYRAICDAIKDDGKDPFVTRQPGGDIEVRIIIDHGKYPGYRRTLDPNLRATIHADGSITRTWADGTVSEEA